MAETVKKNNDRFQAIPFLDLKAQYRSIRKEILEAMEGVLESQAFILGPTVQRFEEQVASYLPCRVAVGVASGTGPWNRTRRRGIGPDLHLLFLRRLHHTLGSNPHLRGH